MTNGSCSTNGVKVYVMREVGRKGLEYFGVANLASVPSGVPSLRGGSYLNSSSGLPTMQIFSGCGLMFAYSWGPQDPLK